MLIRQRIQFDQLFISDDVAGRVGGARDADHPGLFRHLQMLKINMVLKLAFRQQFDVRPGGNEQILFQAGIGVADIFRRQWEQYLTGGAICPTACKQIK